MSMHATSAMHSSYYLAAMASGLWDSNSSSPQAPSTDVAQQPPSLTDQNNLHYDSNAYYYPQHSVRTSSDAPADYYSLNGSLLTAQHPLATPSDHYSHKRHDEPMELSQDQADAGPGSRPGDSSMPPTMHDSPIYPSLSTGANGLPAFSSADSCSTDMSNSQSAYSTPSPQASSAPNPDVPPMVPSMPLASASNIPIQQHGQLHVHEQRKRGHRRIWNHALEKFLFTPQEIATLGAPHRRTIYLASLEAHIDRLHMQLIALGLYPVPFESLHPYKGLNCKTAKGMVAGLQHDVASLRLQVMELERSAGIPDSASSMRRQEVMELQLPRKYSLDSNMPVDRQNSAI